MNTTLMIKSAIKNIPGIEHVFNLHKTGGGATLDARYCYSVWLRHLMFAQQNGWGAVPKTVAELGPGDSLGVGIAALISGASQYYAFDAVRYQPSAVNLPVFDELVALFKARSSVPDESTFPDLKPRPAILDFPDHILTPARMGAALGDDRLARIRRSIEAVGTTSASDTGNMLSFMAPWTDASVILDGSVDMILSQAVLMHVDDLGAAYKAMFRWLKPGGLMSHQIDFKSVGTADTPFGHWEYSDLQWRIIRGRKTYLINREPCSTHIGHLNKCGFTSVCELKVSEVTPMDRGRLATRFKHLTDEDLRTSGLFVQATR